MDQHMDQHLDGPAGQLKRVRQEIEAACREAGRDAASVTLVAVSEFGRNVRENGSFGTDHGRGNAMFVMGRNIAGGRVMTFNWQPLARENLESGQDLKVTIDHRDVLAEVVKNRLANPNVGIVFPDFVPTTRGVTK